MEEAISNTTNITQVIIDTINSIFDNLLQSIDFNIYAILDSLTFVNGSIMQSDNFKSIFELKITQNIKLDFYYMFNVLGCFLLLLLIHFSLKASCHLHLSFLENILVEQLLFC